MPCEHLAHWMMELKHPKLQPYSECSFRLSEAAFGHLTFFSKTTNNTNHRTTYRDWLYT